MRAGAVAPARLRAAGRTGSALAGGRGEGGFDPGVNGIPDLGHEPHVATVHVREAEDLLFRRAVALEDLLLEPGEVRGIRGIAGRDAQVDENGNISVAVQG